MLKQLRRKAYRYRWVIFAVTVSLSFIAVLFLKNNLQDSIVAEGRERLQAIPILMGDQVERELYAAKGELETLADNPVLFDLSTQECIELFEQKLDNLSSSVFVNIARVDANGISECNTLEEARGGSIIGVPFLEELIASPPKKPVIGPVSYNEQINEHFVALHVPVFGDNGEFMGTVGSSILLSSLRVEFLRAYPTDYSTRVMLVSANGSVVFDSQKKQINGAKFQDSDLFDEDALERAARVLEGNAMTGTFEGATDTLAFARIPTFSGKEWYALTFVNEESALREGLNIHPFWQWTQLSGFAVGLIAVVIIGIPSYLVLSHMKPPADENKPDDNL